MFVDPEHNPYAIDEDKAFLPPPEEVQAISCLTPVQVKVVVLFFCELISLGNAICG